MSTVDIPGRPWSPERAQTLETPRGVDFPSGSSLRSECADSGAEHIPGGTETTIMIATCLPAYASGLATWVGAVPGWRALHAESCAHAGATAARTSVAAVIATDDGDIPSLTRALQDHAPLLVLIAEPDRAREVRLVRCGAAGVLLMNVTRTALVNAVGTLLNGGTVISADTLRAVIAPAASHELSTRQAEILGMLATGLTTREIARRLVLTPSTVKTHIARIGDKLGVQGRWAIATTAPALLTNQYRAQHTSVG